MSLCYLVVLSLVKGELSNVIWGSSADWAAGYRVHPYETPAYEVYRVEDF